MVKAHEHGSNLNMYHGSTAISIHPAEVRQLVDAIHRHNLTERSAIVSLGCYTDFELRSRLSLQVIYDECNLLATTHRLLVVLVVNEDDLKWRKSLKLEPAGLR